MSLKNKVIGVRVDDATEKRLERFQSVTKVESVTLARAALDAALNYFEKFRQPPFLDTLSPVVISNLPTQMTFLDSTKKPIIGFESRRFRQITTGDEWFMQ